MSRKIFGRAGARPSSEPKFSVGATLIAMDGVGAALAATSSRDTSSGLKSLLSVDVYIGALEKRLRKAKLSEQGNKGNEAMA